MHGSLLIKLTQLALQDDDEVDVGMEEVNAIEAGLVAERARARAAREHAHVAFERAVAAAGAARAQRAAAGVAEVVIDLTN
jgi:hypothetical protein